MSFRSVLLLGTGLLLLFGACDDPADPCDRPYACEVQGVDLDIVQLDIVTTRYDSLDGLGIVRSDTLEIEAVMRNRGDTILGARGARCAIPPLAI